MSKEIIKDTEDVVKATQKLLLDINKFVEKNIIKVDVKVKEGPLLKMARKEVAKGLRNIADVVEDPNKKIKWVNLKKKPKK